MGPRCRLLISAALGPLISCVIAASSFADAGDAPSPTAVAATTTVTAGTTTPAATAMETPTVAASPSPSPALALPENFPKDLPIMEGSQLAAVRKLGGGAQNVFFTTDAEPSGVTQYYKEALAKKGQRPTQEAQGAGRSFLSFKQGTRVTNIVIAKDPRDPAKTVVAIMYYDEQPAVEF